MDRGRRWRLRRHGWHSWDRTKSLSHGRSGEQVGCAARRMRDGTADLRMTFKVRPADGLICRMRGESRFVRNGDIWKSSLWGWSLFEGFGDLKVGHVATRHARKPSWECRWEKEYNFMCCNDELMLRRHARLQIISHSIKKHFSLEFKALPVKINKSISDMTNKESREKWVNRRSLGTWRVLGWQGKRPWLRSRSAAGDFGPH